MGHTGQKPSSCSLGFNPTQKSKAVFRSTAYPASRQPKGYAPPLREERRRKLHSGLANRVKLRNSTLAQGRGGDRNNQKTQHQGPTSPPKPTQALTPQVTTPTSGEPQAEPVSTQRPEQQAHKHNHCPDTTGNWHKARQACR